MFYKEKVVLVTGGTGFVGTHIVQELLKQEAKIRVPIHNRPLVVKDERIETIQADLTKYEDCLRAAKGVKYVFHVAGCVGSAAAGTLMSGITLNLILTAQMLQAAWEEDVERFLILSSSTGYPVANYPIKEEEMWTGQIHPSYLGYGWMKRYLERLSEFVASKSKMKISIIRPTAVYGRGDNFDLRTCHVIPALIRKAVERYDPYEVWGSGEEVRDFLHISDLARACLLMLEKYATCDPVNIGYGRGFKIKETVKIILKAAGYESARVEFNTSMPTTIPFRMVDTSKAKKILGFESAVSLEEGLEDAIKWYIQTIKRR